MSNVGKSGPANFALTGLAGYIAPRHLQAILDTGNRLIAAVDPHDSVGAIDSYFPDASFFTEVERFDRHLEKIRRLSLDQKVDFISICSPNNLHDARIRLALRVQADAICEKPLVLNPWNLDILQELEEEYHQKVWTVLQLRLHPSLLKLRDKLSKRGNQKKKKVRLTYVTSRGLWYHYSWKGDPEKSGGIATNIGIHFFDMLLWLFGLPQHMELHVNEKNKMAGSLELPGADVEWFLSLDKCDLPRHLAGNMSTYRNITIDDEAIEFSGDFGNLHSRVYEETLKGNGFGIDTARPSIELVHRLRTMPIKQSYRSGVHPYVQRAAI